MVPYDKVSADSCNHQQDEQRERCSEGFISMTADSCSIKDHKCSHESHQTMPSLSITISARRISTPRPSRGNLLSFLLIMDVKLHLIYSLPPNDIFGAVSWQCSRGSDVYRSIKTITGNLSPIRTTSKMHLYFYC